MHRETTEDPAMFLENIIDIFLIPTHSNALLDKQRWNLYEASKYM